VILLYYYFAERNDSNATTQQQRNRHKKAKIHCEPGESFEKDKDVTYEIDGIIETVMSRGAEGGMTTNKSADEYAHELYNWWGELDHNKQSSDTAT
jgi:hypothetical protein